MAPVSSLRTFHAWSTTSVKDAAQNPARRPLPSPSFSQKSAIVCNRKM